MPAVPSRRRSRNKFEWLLVLCLLPALPIHAQVFKLQGGSSTLYHAGGGSLELRAPNYEGSVGAGIFDGKLRLGAMLRSQFHGYTFTAGDDSVAFDLPTDIFDSSYYFPVRGLGLARSSPQGSFYAFAGAASNWMGTSFFQSAEAEDPVAAFFFQRPLTDRLTFFSRSILSRQNTFLQGIEWQLKHWLKTAVTGGVGSGHPYFATTFDAESRKLELKGGYFFTNREFRRIMLPSISNSESEGANIEATYRLNPSVSLTAGHRNLLQLLDLTGPLSGASVNNVGGTFQIAHAYFGVGLFSSSVAARDTWGLNFYAGHRFGEHLDVTANYFRSQTARQPGDTMVSGTFREILNPRVSFLQLVTYSNGQWATSFGGEYLTNRLNLRADYQTVYLPFRGNRPFQQALSLNASLRVFGPLQISAGSSVAPDGSIRYTFGGSTYLYRYNGLMPWGAEAADSYKFPKYLVQGVVRDDQGKPVSGAALRINGEIVYTDDSGRFLYRFRKHKQLAFEVAVDEFLVPGVFQVIRAPASVDTSPEGKAPDVEVVIRRIRANGVEKQFY